MSTHKTEHVEKDFFLQAESVWKKYQKQIAIGIGAIVVIVGGWIAYSQFFKKPAEEKASDAIYVAQRYFEQDSSRLVLDGDGQSKGVLYIIKNYGGTPSANLAHYYAGISYLKLGEFGKAVDHLKDFSTDSKEIQMRAYGALADAYSELKKNSEAIDYYEKAANTFTKDELASAEYLYRAAQLSEVAGKNKEALDLYKEIKAKYPNAKRDIDKNIYRLSIEPNDFSVN
jgi:tetratricopeptide (TPR) repeat protein